MTNITSSMDITLVTLQNCPSDLTVIHQIFDKAAELGIDIDMISLAPSQSAMSSLSFTMSDHDLPKLLTFSSHLHNELGVKTVISSGNSKIIVADEAMQNIWRCRKCKNRYPYDNHCRNRNFSVGSGI